jgi:hypothetical protein
LGTKTIQTISTSTLKNKLFKTVSIKRFVDQFESVLEPEPLHAYMQKLCKDRGEPAERVIKRADIDRTYGHQFFSGLRVPSRDKILQLAFGFELDMEGTQGLLKKARKSPLYVRVKRDAIIIYCLERKMSIDDAQEILNDFELPLLGGK